MNLIMLDVKIKIVILLTYNSLEVCAQTCLPNWTIFKENFENSTYIIERFDHLMVNFSVKRTISYRCTGSSVEFDTGYKLHINPIKGFSCSDEYFKPDLNNCNKLHSTVKVQCTYYKSACILSIKLNKKSCDCLYWSSWNETTSCIAAKSTTYKRRCVDCDGDVFQYQEYCHGKTVRKKTCQPSWSEWEDASPCISSTCSLLGERVRRRKCLYGDGSQANSSQLCSNQLDHMTEQCIFNKTICNSTNRNYSDNVIVFGFIIIAFLVVVVLIIIVRSKINNSAANKSNGNESLQTNDHRVSLPIPTHSSVPNNFFSGTFSIIRPSNLINPSFIAPVEYEDSCKFPYSHTSATYFTIND